MKSSLIAIVVVLVVIVGGVGYIAATHTSLFSSKTTITALPETSPGTRIVSSSEVNQSMSGHWVELMNITIGVSNLSLLMDVMDGITHGTPVSTNASYLHINYAQAAAFVSTNHSAMAFAYASLSSSQFANLTNKSVYSNLTKDNLTNLTVGVTDGSFYIFGYAKADSNYTAAFYDFYSNYIIVGFYHGGKNRTLSDFTNLVTYEISILNSYKLNFSTVEHLASTTSVQTDFTTSYKSLFNISAFLLNPNAGSKALGNYSSLLKGSPYYSILNMTDNGTLISGVGLEAFHSESSNSTLALGYIEGTHSSFVSQIYRNLTTSLNNSLKDSNNGLSVVNMSYDGMTFFVFNTTYSNGQGQTSLNLTFSIGVKGDYLVASAVIGPSAMNTSITKLMQNESSLL